MIARASMRPRTRKSDPDAGAALPVSFVPCSNGEMEPRPSTARDLAAVRLFHERADRGARSLGVSRRDFVFSACGLATAFGVFNVAYGCGGDGGTYAVGAGDRDGAVLDADRACAAVLGDEFVFDVQTHHVDPDGPWRTDPGFDALLGGFPYAACGEAERILCFDVPHFVDEIFVKSDTAVACLSGLPADPARDPLSTKSRAETARIVERLSGSPRLLIHHSAYPEKGAAALDAMQAAAEQYRIAAWKVYPSAGQWRFDDEAIAIPLLEKARALGIKVVCAHRGIAGDAGGYGDFSSPREMAKVAQAFPDLTFLVYHSGWEPGVPEGPYDDANPRGVDRLVKALREFPATNVYAELGATFRGLMTSPEELAHVLGKLLASLGEDRVLWGTDCIWYGSPQEQIAALRAFEIPAAMQERFGYPALTREVKRKILGLSAAPIYGVDPAAVRCAIRADDVARAKEARREDGPAVQPSRPLGPRTRRELLGLLRLG